MTQIKTSREINEDYPDIKWTSQPPFDLYRSPSSRIRVIVENCQVSWRIAYTRADAYAEVGVCSADLDAEEFAKDFVDDFCDHISHREIEALINLLTKVQAEWAAEYKKAMVLYVDKNGK